MPTDTLTNARRNRADEFYTQMKDIQAELRHYREHFRGKSVLCNCDDPYESNFFKYFALNFSFLGLRKLVAVCYKGSPVAGEELPLMISDSEREARDAAKRAYYIAITSVPDADGDGAVGLADVRLLLQSGGNTLKPLMGDGDFRSAECVELLKEADIVVTNPPFSLFREYVAQLMKYGKKFIIIGSKNAITYKEIFKLLKDNKMWLGVGFNQGNAYFRIPNVDGREWANGVFDSKTNLVKFRNIGWFTNLDIPKRHETLTLYKRYTSEEYPRYVNYDAIEVSQTALIPEDYQGNMGVPITFLDKYNPEQFEIVGSSMNLGKPMSAVASKGTYGTGGIRFYLDNGDGTYKRLYDRVVIRRKGAAQ